MRQEDGADDLGKCGENHRETICAGEHGTRLAREPGLRADEERMGSDRGRNSSGLLLLLLLLRFFANPHSRCAAIGGLQNQLKSFSEIKPADGRLELLE
jgi:hypothetical protein